MMLRFWLAVQTLRLGMWVLHNSVEGTWLWWAALRMVRWSFGLCPALREAFLESVVDYRGQAIPHKPIDLA